MQMNLSVWSLIYLFGAAQALLLIIGVNLNKPLLSDRKKITTLLLLAMMMTMIYYVVVINEIIAVYPYIDSLGTASWMAIAPLYYLLNKSVRTAQWELKTYHLWYLIIPVIFMIEGFLTTLGWKVWLYGLVNDLKLYLDLWMLLFFSSGFYFITKVMALEIKEDSRNRELKWFTHTYFLVLLVFLIIYLFVRKDYTVYFEMTLIMLFEVFIFVLVYRVFKIIPFRNFFELSKYENQHHSKANLQQLAQQLEKVMKEEKPYLDQKLTLSELSKLSGINTNDLSQLFAIYYDSNFYHFINQYRLQNLEKMMLDPENAQFKIMALAEASGFNSKATFYKVFKEKHQLTPAQFIKKYR
jgi:AraC-like DNA-binding protein